MRRIEIATSWRVNIKRASIVIEISVQLNVFIIPVSKSFHRANNAWLTTIMCAEEYVFQQRFFFIQLDAAESGTGWFCAAASLSHVRPCGPLLSAVATRAPRVIIFRRGSMFFTGVCDVRLRSRAREKSAATEGRLLGNASLPLTSRLKADTRNELNLN